MGRRFFLVAALLIASIVDAAEPARSLSSLNSRSGQLVYVHTRAGEETLARIVSATDDELVVTVGGVERRIGAAQIRRVKVRGDSLQNGFNWGFGLGLADGVLS